jgi:hypothetical protein
VSRIVAEEIEGEHTSMMASPGNIDTHQALVTNSRPSEIIDPRPAWAADAGAEEAQRRLMMMT